MHHHNIASHLRVRAVLSLHYTMLLRGFSKRLSYVIPVLSQSVVNVLVDAGSTTNSEPLVAAETLTRSAAAWTVWTGQLAVREERAGLTAGRADFWKLPGGLVDPNEDQATRSRVRSMTLLRLHRLHSLMPLHCRFVIFIIFAFDGLASLFFLMLYVLGVFLSYSREHARAHGRGRMDCARTCVTQQSGKSWRPIALPLPQLLLIVASLLVAVCEYSHL